MGKRIEEFNWKELSDTYYNHPSLDSGVSWGAVLDYIKANLDTGKREPMIVDVVASPTTDVLQKALEEAGLSLEIRADGSYHFLGVKREPMSVEEIETTDGCKFAVDHDTHLWAKFFSWKVDQDGYAMCGNRTNKKMVIHRIIVDCPDDMEVDHIDGNRLNNVRSNLRVVTHQQNGMNRRIGSNNTCGYKGVCWIERDQKFLARIKVAGKRYSLGYFDTAKEAHEAYVEKAKELHREFANDGKQSLAVSTINHHATKMTEKTPGEKRADLLHLVQTLSDPDKIDYLCRAAGIPLEIPDE